MAEVGQSKEIFAALRHQGQGSQGANKPRSERESAREVLNQHLSRGGCRGVCRPCRGAGSL